MKTLVIIPAHNEADHIGACLDSFVIQERKPDLLLVVDDNSTDKTAEKVAAYTADHPWIQMIYRESEASHQPGKKVVDTFNFGLSQIDTPFELIGKFDADIVLPPAYFRRVIDEFKSDSELGLCSGLLYVEQGGRWVYETIANKDHVRGPVKLYRRSCLEAMNYLRPSIGWDTLDELLAQYHGYTVRTLHDLVVRHLRPTGSTYSATAARLQGKALYLLRYGWSLAFLSALKMGLNRHSPGFIYHCLKGFAAAAKSGEDYLVNAEEGRFIRDYRWKNIRRKLF